MSKVDNNNFEFPEIKGSDLFVETDFFKWLHSKNTEGVKYDNFITAIQVYTKHIQHPFKGRSDGQAHKGAYEAFHYSLRTKEDYFKPVSNIQ